ncbi:hypothetical protein BPA01_26420 [Brevibacillus parabrevis]|uniref:Uncharacterized protein n=1 Tax=Brevibacillus parabrevis TaxID=54914 RepID=A0A4Y3PF13_BREPA|nr:hypothetical protein BPA01_26420 [Brevibacillus parabrevis]
MEKPCSLFGDKAFFCEKRLDAVHLLEIEPKTLDKKSKKTPSRIDRLYIHIDIYCFY